jgi:hypothetical protein
VDKDTQASGVGTVDGREGKRQAGRREGEGEGEGGRE